MRYALAGTVVKGNGSGRWREIERLYHAAVARPATEREAYLAEACAGDEALRR